MTLGLRWSDFKDGLNRVNHDLVVENDEPYQAFTINTKDKLEGVHADLVLKSP